MNVFRLLKFPRNASGKQLYTHHLDWDQHLVKRAVNALEHTSHPRQTNYDPKIELSTKTFPGLLESFNIIVYKVHDYFQ